VRVSKPSPRETELEVQSPKSKVQSQDENSSTLDFGLRTQDLNAFHPTNVIVTAREIIFLWVSRMVMAALKFVGERPFDDVYITGTVLDENGLRMSKSKGNGVDPLEVFDKYGVDATRMTLAGSATGANFAWRDEKVESYRNFANKIWNATRFCLMNAEGAKVDPGSIEICRNPHDSKGVIEDNYRNPHDSRAVIEGNCRNPHDSKGVIEDNCRNPNDSKGVVDGLPISDRWIISRLNKTAKHVNEALDKYAFHVAVDKLYHFFWDDFCDWYIELVKDEISSASNEQSAVSSKTEEKGGNPTVMEGTESSQIEARTRIITILEQSLRLLHPFMPYLTEELWQKLPNTNADLHNAAYRSADPTIMLADFPVGDESLIDEKAESEMQLIFELITKIRNIRAEMQIKPSDKISVHIAANDKIHKIFHENEAQILKLARANKIIIAGGLDVPDASAKGVLTNGAEIAIPLEGLIDFPKERERLQNQIIKLVEEGERLSKQLSNENFVSKAPAEKVEAVRERVAEIETQTKTLNENLESLK